jgi:glycosyltransferase involved in cell wall biosynthesis
MNIVVIPNRGFGTDGISSYIMTNYQYFDHSRNHYVLIYSYINGKPEDVSSRTEEFKRLGGDVYFIDRKKVGLKGYVLSLGDILRKEKIEIVHIHGSSASITLEEWIARRSHVKKIITHSHNTNSGHRLIHHLLRPLATAWSDVHLACGELAGKWMYGNHPFRVMPNAIDTARYLFNPTKRDELRKHLQLSDKDIVLGNVGSLQNSKNQQFLLRLLRDNHGLPLRLVLIGQGVNLQMLKNLASQYGVADKVKFLGQRNDVPDLLNAMDIFVLPSLFEGFPIVAVEAQASGLPCLLSDQISQEVKLTDLLQYLPINSTKPWLSAISNITVSTEQRPKYCKEIADKGFEVKVAAKELEKLYTL